MSPSIATMTSSGQVTIPQAVRETLGLEQGDPVLFEERDGLIVVCKYSYSEPLWDASVCSTLTEWEDSLDDDL